VRFGPYEVTAEIGRGALPEADLVAMANDMLADARADGVLPTK